MNMILKKDFGAQRRKPDPADMALAKMPPQVPDMEEAVLGSCLNDSGHVVLEQVLGFITEPAAFYKVEHQKIFAAMLRLYMKGSPIDLVLLTDELHRTNELDMVGGGYALTLIAKKAANDAFTEYYCQIIMEKYLRRELLGTNARCMKDAYDDGIDVFKLIERSSDEHYRLLAGSIQQEPHSAEKDVRALLQQMEMQRAADTDITGIPTGFHKLDAITGGWQRTDLNILAARPSVGKTAFALSLALTAAAEMAPVLIFSLEMGHDQIIKRMMAAISGVPLRNIIRANELTEQERARVHSAAETLATYPIYTDDKAGITVTEMRAKVRKQNMKNGIQLVIVDYLQLMSGTGNEGNREQEISRISRGLKAMAKDLEVPIIALSQLSRGIENASGEATRDPRLSDLRESGAIEQDADNVFFVTNPSASVIAQNPDFRGRKIITIAKGRNIGLGRVSLEFNSDTQKWKDIG